MKSGNITFSVGFLYVAVALWTAEAFGEFEKNISVQFPAVVNIYEGSGTTEEEVKEAVREANKLLAQASFKLVVRDNCL
jgi:hypothetical protein